jgi:DNA-directed RNA polymerase I subunit RPA43
VRSKPQFYTMSVEVDKIGEKKKKHRKERKDHAEGDSEPTGKRKRHAEGSSQIREASPKKKYRSEKLNASLAPQDQPSTTELSSKKSPFHQLTASLYLPLSPICQRYALQGLCAEHISPLLLTYYPPFQGVILSYSNPRLSEDVDGREEGAEHVPAMAISMAEFAASFIWVTADFLIFKPEKGRRLEGWVNLQNESHLGLICWNLFNASIERKRLPGDWRWVAGDIAKKSKTKLKKSREDAEVDDGGEENGHVTAGSQEIHVDEGYFEDSDGNKIEGSIMFKIQDFDASMNTDKERNYLSIEGSLLSKQEEKALAEQEMRQGGHSQHSSRPEQRSYFMSGSLVNGRVDRDHATTEEGVQKRKHRLSY